MIRWRVLVAFVMMLSALRLPTNYVEFDFRNLTAEPNLCSKRVRQRHANKKRVKYEIVY